MANMLNRRNLLLKIGHAAVLVLPFTGLINSRRYRVEITYRIPPSQSHASFMRSAWPNGSAQTRIESRMAAEGKLLDGHRRSTDDGITFVRVFNDQKSFSEWTELMLRANPGADRARAAFGVTREYSAAWV